MSHGGHRVDDLHPFRKRQVLGADASNRDVYLAGLRQRVTTKWWRRNGATGGIRSDTPRGHVGV